MQRYEKKAIAQKHQVLSRETSDDVQQIELLNTVQTWAAIKKFCQQCCAK